MYPVGFRPEQLILDAPTINEPEHKIGNRIGIKDGSPTPGPKNTYKQTQV